MRYEEKKHLSNKEKVIRRITAFIVALIVLVVVGALLFGAIQLLQAQKRADKIDEVIVQADKLMPGYFYDEALALLENQPDLIDPEDPEDLITAKITEINRKKDALVKYHGGIHHIFFHSLIIYPELAFDDKGAPAKGYNNFMTTVTEFKRMLPLLQEKGYILYPINELYTVD